MLQLINVMHVAKKIFYSILVSITMNISNMWGFKYLHSCSLSVNHNTAECCNTQRSDLNDAF